LTTIALVSLFIWASIAFDTGYSSVSVVLSHDSNVTNAVNTIVGKIKENNIAR
jgi:hypothetical protein